MMWNGYGPGAGWEGWLGPMLMIVFVVAIVFAIVYLVRYLAPQQPVHTQGSASPAVMATPPVPPETPQDILKRRYAAGEIEREEYLQRLGDL